MPVPNATCPHCRRLERENQRLHERIDRLEAELRRLNGRVARLKKDNRACAANSTRHAGKPHRQASPFRRRHLQETPQKAGPAQGTSR